MTGLLAAIIIGFAIMLAVWSVFRIIVDVPEQDRTYLDRPPLGFRLIWPIISFINHYFASVLTARYRKTTTLRIKKAGMDYSVNAEQFFSAKIVAACVAMLLSLLVQSMLDNYTLVFILISGLIGFFYPEIWLKEAAQKREREIFKALPFYLDIITLSIESGSNLTGAFTQAVQKSPDGPLRSEINRVLRDVRAGKPRAESLRDMADRVQSSAISNLVSSLVQAEKVGSSLGPILRAQADQRRTERFLKAEKMAMEAPVKLLGPLIMFIFPNTFVVLAFVLLVKAAQAGVLTWKPLLWALTWPSGVGG